MSEMFRNAGTLLVCGSRLWDDAATLHRVLDAWAPGEIVVGDCPTGADLMAREWAEERGVSAHVYVAAWKSLGRRAGPVRNREMVELGKPDAAIAFGRGDGTDGCVRLCEAAGVPVHRVGGPLEPTSGPIAEALRRQRAPGDGGERPKHEEYGKDELL